jgi:hypothetical protein
VYLNAARAEADDVDAVVIVRDEEGVRLMSTERSENATSVHASASSLDVERDSGSGSVLEKETVDALVRGLAVPTQRYAAAVAGVAGGVVGVDAAVGVANASAWNLQGDWQTQWS